MTNLDNPPPTQFQILTGALITGMFNAVINGTIQAFTLYNHAPVALSMDSISSSGLSVLGSAVPLAVNMAMVLTAVSYFTLKASKRRFFPTVAWLIIKHGFFTFGIVVTAAVIWQRFFGTITVSLTVAVLVLACISGMVAAVVNYATIRSALVRAT